MILEPERRTPLFGEFDVVVLGGGPAGIAAAASAARNGASTLLVERYGFLGGMGTAAGVTNFCGLHANVHGEHRQVVRGVVDELLDRMRALDGLSEPHLVLGRVQAQAYDVSAYKCAADALLADAGASVLFHATAAGVVGFPSGIDCLLVETRSGRRAVRGLAFIDCSGDGDLASWAEAPLEKGDASGALLYPTMMFRVGGVDNARAGEAWRSIPPLMEQAERSGEFRFPRKGAIVRPQKHEGEWRVNVTQLRNADGSAVDGTDAAALSAAEVEGRRQAVEYLRFLRAKVPGFERAYLLELAPQVGIRETRRLAGLYQLTREDVLGCASFADSIGVNAWPVENHVAGDVRWEWPAEGSRGYNQLPFRMLVPQSGPPNLLVAGRCASMTHEGQSAARVSGGCFVMGQAAGTAAACAMRGDIAPREVPYLELRVALERGGVFPG
ncbi:MAG TPA: FAD-dependent oxidoreductase [Usitatibacter sp.]|nr:FAD-dependent oxidoreductase [Usitatibacter sp.]